jgi:hypothetical protein
MNKLLILLNLIAAVPCIGWAGSSNEIFDSELSEPGEVSDLHGGLGSAMQFSNKGPVRLLVGFQFHGFPKDGKPQKNWRFVWIEATPGVALNGDGKGYIRSIDFTANLFTWVDSEENTSFARQIVRWVPISYQKDVDVGFSQATVRLFEWRGADLSAVKPENKDPLFLKCVVDALGASLLSTLGDGKQSLGAYLFGMHATGGLKFNIPSNFPDGAVLRWNIATVGINMATNLMQLDANSEVAYVLKSRSFEASFFVKAGIEESTFSTTKTLLSGTAENDPDIRQVGKAYILSGLNVAW